MVLGSLLALLLGGAWPAMHYADVTLCGERLCANVERDGPRYGDRGQYVPVRPR